MAAKAKFLHFKLANSANLAEQLPTVRFFSNSRANKSRDSKLSSRSPLMQISKASNSQNMSKAPSSAIRSTYAKVKEFKELADFRESRKILSFDQINEKIPQNESLLIESLYVVPKCRRLNPIREKLIRLFKCESKSRTKTHEKAVIACENLEWVKEDVETPSPVIKPKYLHKP